MSKKITTQNKSKEKTMSQSRYQQVREAHKSLLRYQATIKSADVPLFTPGGQSQKAPNQLYRKLEAKTTLKSVDSGLVLSLAWDRDENIAVSVTGLRRHAAAVVNAIRANVYGQTI